jgi:hypothetical protein
MQRSRATWIIATAIAVLGLAAVAGCEDVGAPTTTMSSLTVTSATTPAETPSSTPGAAADLTAEEVRSLVAAEGLYAPGSPTTIFDQASFGDWAGAYVWVEGEDVYLVLFRYQGSSWTIVDSITGLEWVDMQARMRSLGAPENLIAWSYPEGD